VRCAQALLTGEPALVSLAAALLEEVLAPHADALGGLAQTGALFFALAYCGSNLTELARLLQARARRSRPRAPTRRARLNKAFELCVGGRPCLREPLRLRCIPWSGGWAVGGAAHGVRAQVAHLAQRAGSGAGGEGGGLAARSALGGLVPEALLHMLASYGAGAFAAALVGDSDTPELIWTHRMRAQRLVPEARAAPAPAAPRAPGCALASGARSCLRSVAAPISLQASRAGVARRIARRAFGGRCVAPACMRRQSARARPPGRQSVCACTPVMRRAAAGASRCTGIWGTTLPDLFLS